MAKKVKEDNKKIEKVEDTAINNYDFVYGEKLSLSPEEQERLVEKYVKLVSESLVARKDRESEWQENAQILSNQRPPKDKPWKGCSNVATGTSAEIRDTVAETIVAREYSSDRIYNLIGEDDYSQDNEEKVERWLNYVIDTPEEFNFTDEFVRAFATDDTAVAIVNMEREEATIKKWVKLSDIWADKDAGFIKKMVLTAKNIFGDYTIKEEKIVKVKHACKVLKIEDVVAPGNATNNTNKLPWFGYFFFPSLSELQNRNVGEKKFYENLEKLETKSVKQESNNETKKNEKDAKIAVKNNIEGPKVVVLFVKEDLKKDGTLQDVTLVFEYDNNVYMRSQLNQYFHGKKPSISASAMPDRDSFWGISIPSIIRPLQLDTESMINQFSDNWDLVIKKVFWKIKTAKITAGGKDDDDATITPGIIVDVLSKDDIGVLNVGSVDYNSLPLINKFEAMMAKRAGFAASGNADATDPRASGKKLGMMLSQGSIRIDAMFKRYNNAKSEYAKMLISLYAQFGDKILEYRVWDGNIQNPDGSKGGYKTETLDRDILQDAKFKINLNGLQYSTSREEEKQEELWFYETILKNPLLAVPPMQLAAFSESQIESISEITKQLFRKYGKNNKERFVPTTDSIKTSIQAAVAAQIEQHIKNQAKIALANPNKARPDELGKVGFMAERAAGGGQPVEQTPVGGADAGQ